LEFDQTGGLSSHASSDGHGDPNQIGLNLELAIRVQIATGGAVQTGGS
jgi:hypothetical protein